MPRDTRNSLHIYYIKDGKELHKVVYPKEILGNKVDWRQFNYPMAFELYNQGWTEVCKFFKVPVPDDLDFRVRWCWDKVHIPTVTDPPEREKEEYKLYKDLFIDSHINSCTDSMFSDSYEMLVRACKAEYGDEEMMERRKRGETDTAKSYFDLNYLFYDMIYSQGANIEKCGAWVLRDGSYITCDTAQHRRLVEDYMGFKEYDMERYWVKISMGTVYTHSRMTSAQDKTLNKFFLKYELDEKNIEEW